MNYSEEQRVLIGSEIKGKTIAAMYWSDGLPPIGGYWVLEFTDGSEMCVRLMAEVM